MVKPCSNCKYEEHVIEKNPQWNTLNTYVCHNKNSKFYGQITIPDAFGNSPICDTCPFKVVENDT